MPSGAMASAECGWFSSAQNNTDLRETKTKGGYELNKVWIIELILWLILTGMGTHAREADGERCLPTGAHEVLEVSGEAHRFNAPIC